MQKQLNNSIKKIFVIPDGIFWVGLVLMGLYIANQRFLFFSSLI